jgi:hypothetical protein
MGGYAFHLPLLAMLFFTLPLALLPAYHLPLSFISGVSMIFSAAPFVMFALAQYVLAGWSGLKRLWALPVLAILFMGLSPAISASVISGLRHTGGVFERTPKQGRGPRRSALPSQMALRDFLPEFLAFAYALLSFTIVAATGRWGLAPLPGLFLVGSGLTLALELQEYWAVRRAQRPRRASRLTRPGDIRTG